MSSCPACTCAVSPGIPPFPGLPPSSPTHPPNLPVKSAFGAQGEDAELLAALASNLPVLFVMVVLFVIFHIAFHRIFYLNIVRRNVPPPSSSGPCGWISHILQISDAEYCQYAGIDAFCFVEYLKLVIRILFSMSSWAVAVNMTFYLISINGNTKEDLPPGFLARASLANLPSVGDGGNWQTWSALLASLVGMYVCSGYFYYSWYTAWIRVITKVQSSMSVADDVTSYTMLVRSTDPSALPQKRSLAERTWRHIYPGEVQCVRMVRDTGALPKQLALLDRLEAALPKLEAAAKAPAAKGLAALCAASPASRQRKVEQCRAKLNKARDAVAALKERYCGEDADAGLSYFVLFKTRRTATIAKQVLNLPDASFEVVPAPVPTAVRWEALKPSAERFRAPISFAASCLYAAMLFFYAVPIGIVSTLMNLSSLYELLPFLRDILQAAGPTLESFIAALLPTVALLAFVSLLPTLCIFISSCEHAPAAQDTSAAARATSAAMSAAACPTSVLCHLRSLYRDHSGCTSLPFLSPRYLRVGL